jgi:arylformamidase
MNDPVHQYLTGQIRPGQTALLAAFERESALALTALAPSLDVPYGPHPRERFDLFRAPDARGTVVYLHAGYWQSRDKSQFRFLAPSFVRAGLSFALVNYPLCPEVTLATLTESVRGAVPVILDAMQSKAGLIAAGHSAGAQLAVELALTDWTVHGMARGAISAVVALSGVYDLQPLLATPLNDGLRLDATAAAAASPLYRVCGGLPAAIFAVGALETEAFREQTRAMYRAWIAAGNVATMMVVDSADHFSLLRAMEQAGAPLFRAIGAMITPGDETETQGDMK